MAQDDKKPKKPHKPKKGETDPPDPPTDPTPSSFPDSSDPTPMSGYTPGTYGTATLMGLIDPNGGTLYTDTAATTAATAVGQVVRGNKDAFSGLSAFVTAAGSFSATLQTAGPGFSVLRTVTNAGSPSQGSAVRFGSGGVDPGNAVFFLLHRPYRDFLGSSDMYGDVGNAPGGTAVTLQVAFSTTSGRPSTFNGTGFATVTAPLMNLDCDFSLLVVKSQAGQGNTLLSRDLEQAVMVSRSAAPATGTGWTVYGRNPTVLFGRGDILLAEAFSGTMSDAEIAQEVTAIAAYRASLGTPQRVTGANVLIVGDGDSNCVGIGATAYHGTWVRILADRVALSAGLTADGNLFARNVGAASRLFTHLSAYSAATIEQLNAVTGRALYLVHCGENDAQTVTAQTVWSRATAHFSAIRTACPEAVIGWLNLPPRVDNAAGYEGNRYGIQQMLLADPTMGGLINFYCNITDDTQMGLTGQVTSVNYYSDNIHYSAIGHFRIVDSLSTTPLQQLVMPYFAVGSQSVSPTAQTVTGGTVISLTSSAGPTPTAPKNVVWSGHPNLTAVTATGTTQIPLTAATFVAPASAKTAQVFVLTATNLLARTAVAFATITVEPTAVLAISLTPTAASLTGGQVQPYTATLTVTGGPSTAVTWTVPLGTINGAGAYTAPVATTAAQTALVTAVSVFDAAFIAYATAFIAAAATAAPTGDGESRVNNIGLGRKWRNGPDDDEPKGFISLASPGMMSHGINTAPKLGTRNKPR